MDLARIEEALGTGIVQDSQAFLKRALASLDPADEDRHDALAELLISMIVTVIGRGASDAAFVSRLDNLAEELRSAGMAGRISQPPV